MSDDTPDQLDLQHDEEGGRYVLRSAGETVGLVDYRQDGDVLDLHHTEVVPEGQGQGIGTVLVRQVLDELRTHGQQIVPSCPFVAKFVEEHPDYADLVAS